MIEVRLGNMSLSIDKMAKSAKHSKRLPSPDDSVLATDSEEDEFAAERNPQNESDDGAGTDFEEDDEEEVDAGGRGLWQPDDWDEEEKSDAEASGSEDEAGAEQAESSASEEDDSGEMVSHLLLMSVAES